MLKIGNNLSESFLVTKGLRQGCWLSPNLYNIYLNEAFKNGAPTITDDIQQKQLTWYGHVEKVRDEQLSRII